MIGAPAEGSREESTSRESGVVRIDREDNAMRGLNPADEFVRYGLGFVVDGV